MTPAQAMEMARRIARRFPDSSVADRDDFTVVAATALLDAGDQPDALLWVIGKRAIVDELRRVHGRAGTAKYAAREFDIADTYETLAGVAELPHVEQVALAHQLRAALPRIELLTEANVRILQMAAEGYSSRTGSAELHVSSETWRSHIARCRRVLGARSTAHAVAIAIRLGYVDTTRITAAPAPTLSP